MDNPGYLTMSAKELNRLEVLNRVLDRRLTQAQAVEQLGLGDQTAAPSDVGAADASSGPRIR